jgi:hypothetical protein
LFSWLYNLFFSRMDSEELLLPLPTPSPTSGADSTEK